MVKENLFGRSAADAASGHSAEPEPISVVSTVPVSVPNAVADGLRKARALIERGWTQHDFCRNGAVCATGAIHKAISGDPYDCAEGCEAVEKALAEAILDKYWIAGGALVSWNDEEGRTQAEVIAAFDRAIELAEKQA